jgi:hypothetical protein
MVGYSHKVAGAEAAIDGAGGVCQQQIPEGTASLCWLDLFCRCNTFATLRFPCN